MMFASSILGQALVLSLAEVLGIGNIQLYLEELKQGNYLESLPVLKLLLMLSHAFVFIPPALLFVHWLHLGEDGVPRGTFKAWFGSPMAKVPRGTILFPLALGLTLVAYPILQASYEFNLWLLGPTTPNELQTILLKMQSWSDVWQNILLLGVVAAVGEELLFRGVVQKLFLQQQWPPILAVLATAAVFSLGHFESAAFLPRFLFGALFGYFYWRSQSLLLPILAHCLHNAWQVVYEYQTQGQYHVDFAQPIWLLPSVLLTALGLWLFQGQSRNTA
jgi:membrane protease YdiL (CAAX protease family)